jgi:uncharacterized protein (DUF983 family)
MREVLMKKRCPRCGGNIYLEEDSFGCYEHCLQCGYEGDLENTVESPEQLVLSKIGEPSTLNVNKLTRPKVIAELLPGHLVAELTRD